MYKLDIHSTQSIRVALTIFLFLVIEVKKLMLNLYQGFFWKIFLALEPSFATYEKFAITDLNFKRNFYNLALSKHVHSAFLLMEDFFWAFQLVTLFHMITKIIIAIIAPFPPWISGLNEILRILNNCIVLY